MLRLGIDVGSQYTKAALVDGPNGNSKVHYGLRLTGFDMRLAVEEAIEMVLKEAGLSRTDIGAVGITGQGADLLELDEVYGRQVNGITAAAAGSHFFLPECRTILDAGAEEARGIRCNEKGFPTNFALSDKCAAGAGTFVETMAKALKMSTDEFIDLSVKSTAEIPLNAQCVIFAESEVVSLIHSDTPAGDIAKAVHDAIAERTGALVRTVGIQPEVVAVGGLSLNKAYVASLRRQLGVDVKTIERAQHVLAVGAALNAAPIG